MKKIVKKLMLILSIFFITGCSVNYDLLIQANGKVDEKIKLTIPNEEIIVTDKNIKKTVKNEINTYLKFDNYRAYEFKPQYYRNSTDVLISRSYENLEQYKNSVFLKNLFDQLYVFPIKKDTVIQTGGNYHYSYLYGGGENANNSKISSATLTIILEHDVVESNADKVDKNNNTFTWYLDKNNKTKEIYIRFSDKLRYDIIIKNFIFKNIFHILIWSSLIITLLVGFVYLLYQQRKHNRI